jgi:hypothetical protein
MRETRDVIEILVHAGRDRAPGAAPLGRAFVAGMAPPIAISALFLGFQSDGGALLGDPLVLLRIGFLIALGLAAFSLLEALGKPGARVAWWRLGAPLGVLLATFWLDLSGMLPAGRKMATPYWICPASILTLSVLPVAALLRALRTRAPTRPAVTGAVAGLAGGAIAATLYALWCVETAPGTTALWFGSALALTSALGALAGRFVLRW